MLCGGTITARHEPPGSSPILEVTLSRPLPKGEVGSLEYQANYSPGAPWRPSTGRWPARASNVDIVVQFNRQRLPRGVWWTVWDDCRDGTILNEHPVSLDQDGRAHRYLTCLENAAAGFWWEW